MKEKKILKKPSRNKMGNFISGKWKLTSSLENIVMKIKENLTPSLFFFN